MAHATDETDESQTACVAQNGTATGVQIEVSGTADDVYPKTHDALLAVQGHYHGESQLSMDTETPPFAEREFPAASTTSFTRGAYDVTVTMKGPDVVVDGQFETILDQIKAVFPAEDAA